MGILVIGLCITVALLAWAVLEDGKQAAIQWFRESGVGRFIFYNMIQCAVTFFDMLERLINHPWILVALFIIPWVLLFVVVVYPKWR